MFVVLSVKTTLFTLLLISLASISVAQEDKPIKFTLSIQKSINHPESSIALIRTDKNIRWSNDNRISTNTKLIYSLILPITQVSFNYRKHTIQGVHNGETLKEECIFISCFWVSGSFISGLESNEEIHYQIDNNELWIEKPFHIKNINSMSISPLIGLNVIPSKFTIYGTDTQKSRSPILPIPFWGINLEKKLSSTIKIIAKFHHLNYENTDWSVLYKNYQVGIEKRIAKDIDISIGYSKYYLNTEYDKNSIDASFNLSSDSSFIKISTHF